MKWTKQKLASLNSQVWLNFFTFPRIKTIFPIFLAYHAIYRIIFPNNPHIRLQNEAIITNPHFPRRNNRNVSGSTERPVHLVTARLAPLAPLCARRAVVTHTIFVLDLWSLLFSPCRHQGWENELCPGCKLKAPRENAQSRKRTICDPFLLTNTLSKRDPSPK
jgi:hypothetical protein